MHDTTAPVLITGGADTVPSVQVVLKLVIALPLSAGATKLATSCVLPATSVGAAG